MYFSFVSCVGDDDRYLVVGTQELKPKGNVDNSFGRTHILGTRVMKSIDCENYAAERKKKWR